MAEWAGCGSARAREAPGAAGKRGRSVPVALPEASSVPLPAKVANSWSPFAATVTYEPATSKVLGPVRVSASVEVGRRLAQVRQWSPSYR